MKYGFQAFTSSQVANPTLGTCATVNCHFETTTPVWGSNKALTNCDTCHNSLGVSPSHGKHVSAYGGTLACTKCHSPRTTFDHATSAGHVGRNIDITIPTYVGSNFKYLPGQTGRVLGTCSTIYCHSSGQSATGGALTAGDYVSVTWGGSATCGSCHGTTALASGSHTKHFTGITPSTNCGSCHVGASSSAYASTLHVDGFINVTGAYSKTKSHTPGTGYGFCSAASCHDNGKGVPAVTPTWGATGTTACTACHALVPAGTSHDKHVTTTTYKKTVCADCHTGYVQGTTAAANHLNTTIEVNTGGYPSPKAKGSAVGSCATSYCHSSGQSATGGLPPVYGTAPTWNGTVTCGSCHATTTLASGSHTKHFTGLTPNTNCGTCHSGASTAAYASTLHVDGFINVTGAYSKTKSHTPGTGYGFCSAASCHDNGKGVAAVTPTWGATGTPACTACHALVPAGTSHDKHVTTTTYKKTVCADCHTGYVQGTTAAANHLNTTIEVNAGGYPSPKAKGSAVGSCATSYCHSSGQSATGGLPPVYGTAPTWNGTVTCGSCHATTTLASGSHAKHFTGISPNTNCGTCHSGASTAAYASTLHVDGFINVTGAYSKTKSHTPGTGYGFCSAASCHSNGKGVVATTPTWGATGLPTCSACHAVAPTDSSHSKHLGAAVNAACATCHAGYVQGSTAAANHLNGLIEVAGYAAPKTPGTAPGTCTTVYCHSNGSGTYASQTWGATNIGCAACHPNLSGAHSKHVGNLLSSVSFYNYTANMSAGNDTVGGWSYKLGCANCHPVDVAMHNNGTVNVQLAPLTPVALNSSLRSKNLSGTVYNADKSCDLVYCHSDGKNPMAVGGNGKAPVWTTTFAALGVDRCAQCHGNSPTTGAHQAHVVGIHQDDIFNGTGGKLAAVAGPADSSHGNAAQSTTINCNTCHNLTVTSARNDENLACVGCHTAKTNKASIANLGNHINGKVDFSFAAIPVISRAQVRQTSFDSYSGVWKRNANSYKTGATPYDTAKKALDTNSMWSAGTCSNIACHNGKTVQWTDSLSCDSCHTAL
jgi:predicted CxxxxCH...CXXCH cytochrome family protein